MKKRIISATLTLAMVIALLASLCVPSFATASPIIRLCNNIEPLEVDKTYYSTDLDCIKSGSVKLEVINGVYTLKLDNARISCTGTLVNSAIYVKTFIGGPAAAIKLIGTNFIDCGNENKINGAIFSVGASPLTIYSDDGTGILNVNNDVIQTLTGIDINTCTLNVNNAQGESAILSMNNPININNSKVTAVGGQYGIRSDFSVININGNNCYVIAESKSTDNDTKVGAAILSTGTSSLSSTRGIISIDPALEIKKGGKIVKLALNAGETASEESDNVITIGCKGASKYVEIGPRTTPPSDNNNNNNGGNNNGGNNNGGNNTVITNNTTPHAAGVNTNTGANTKTIASTGTPKAAIADTGESSIIMPIIAVIAVASVGAITFILRKKVTQ